MSKKPAKEKPLSKAEQIRADNLKAATEREESWAAYYSHRVDHITKGENKKGTPVGFHTKKLEGKGAVCKTFGEATPIAKSGGCYKQWVAVVTNANPKADDKTKVSTFFPDQWTLEQIEAVCKSAFLNAKSQDLTKNFTSKATEEPGVGMPLRFSADSIYPDYDH
jgi:hypothetical protein